MQRSGSFLTPLLTDRRVQTALGLGFSSGLPLLLVYSTQSVWLRQANVPIETIGLLSELTLAYKFKFLWAPFLDRYDVPGLSALVGRRRGWIIVAQIGVALALAGVAFGDPASWLAWTALFSLALGFAAATQDTVIDGWRITVAPKEMQPLLTSWAEIGWRVGNLAAGAGALYLADAFGWRAAYLCMAALMAPGVIVALLAPEPESDKRALHEPPPKPKSVKDLIWTPIKEMSARLGPMAWPILLMIAGFRMPGYISTAMANPLFVDLHYSPSDIATVTKVFGFWLALAATFLGGWIVPRLGMMGSLLFGTLFGSLSHLALAYLAVHGDHNGGEFWTFAVAVSIDSFAYAFASIILITYMATIVSTEHAASQFALLTSLCAFPGSILAGFSGFLVKHMGFELFFLATSLIGIPVAILCWRVGHQHQRIEAVPAT